MLAVVMQATRRSSIDALPAPAIVTAVIAKAQGSATAMQRAKLVTSLTPQQSSVTPALRGATCATLQPRHPVVTQHVMSARGCGFWKVVHANGT